MFLPVHATWWRWAAGSVLSAAAACAPSRSVTTSAPAPASDVPVLAGALGVGAQATSPPGVMRDAIAGEQVLPGPNRAVLDSAGEQVRIALSALSLFGDSSLVLPNDLSPLAGREGGLQGTGDIVGEEPSWDIDVRSFLTRDRVEHYVTLFSGPARTRFTTWLQRGRRFEPMIRETFRARGIPEDLYYLAAVESGYDPHAVSRAYAVGMWQFMTRTARGFGLRVNWWVDDRRDPVKATAAAARFISSLKEQFGSFYLAAAAYNGGPGRVARGLTRYADDMEDADGEERFFALAETGYLRRETREYVPQLIAAALIGKEPQRFGITLDSVVPYAYDSVFVPGGTSLGAVASASGSSLMAIRELNPFILRGMTPPDSGLYVRVPVASAATFAATFATLPVADTKALRTLTATKGQTLANVASANDMTVRQLKWYNPRVKTLKSGRVRAGERIQVPAPQVVAAAFDVPDPAIERYGSGARRSRGSRAHVVRRGETLGSIAKSYRTSVEALTRLNGLKRRVIYPGQSIIVRGSTRAPSTGSARPGVRPPARTALKKKKAAPR